MKLFMEYGLENGGNFVGQQGKELEVNLQLLGDLANTYQTFCKD